MRELRVLAGVAIALALSTPGWSAEDPLQGDLRDLRVGMQVGDLPAVGYVGLACGNDGGEPGQALASWAEFDRCPADAAGLREIAFEYDDSLQPWAAVSDKWEGTQVAGHPVIPSLLIDDQGVVQRIRIVTDPEARLYLKKKAFLLPIRVMGRYGRDGWDCVDAEPARGHDPGRRHVHRPSLRKNVPRSPAGARDPPVSHRRAERPGVHRPDPARDHQRRRRLIGRITASRPVAPDPRRRPSPRSRCPAGAGGRPNRTRPGCASGCPDRGSWRRSRSRRRRRRWCGSTG